MLGIKDSANRLHFAKEFTGTGAAAGSSSRPISIQGYTQITVAVENVGGGNTLVVKGRLKDAASFDTLSTISGSSTGTNIAVDLYDEVYFDVTAYSASGGTPKVIASGTKW